MKVVIDTNVFVSSFFGGKPREIIELWHHGKIHLCISQAIVEEYIEVIKRLGLQDDKELEDLLKLFGSSYNMVFVVKTPKLNIVKSDPDDNKFIECAISTGSKMIISGDKHLLEIKKYIDVDIMKPKDFLNYYGKDAG